MYVDDAVPKALYGMSCGREWESKENILNRRGFIEVVGALAMGCDQFLPYQVVNTISLREVNTGAGLRVPVAGAMTRSTSDHGA